MKLQTIVQPVLMSHKIGQEFLTSKPKPPLIDQQCILYNFKCDQAMLVMSDTPTAICSYALMDMKARPCQCTNTMIIDVQAGFRMTIAVAFVLKNARNEMILIKQLSLSKTHMLMQLRQARF